MEGLSKKRKGVQPDLSSARKKKRCNGDISTPTFETAQTEFQCRGFKRNVGCIDAATCVVQKKKIDHDYNLAKTSLGQGKFGSVVLCRSKATGEKFACKILKKGGEEIVQKEVEIMQHLSGYPGLVTLKAVYEDSESFHLVMELCSGGSLLDQMAREGQYSESKVAGIIKDLMLAVRYCHEMGVVHRDIKPENILMMASGQMKLGDFGLAERFLDGQSLTGIVGSPGYVAPEVLAGSYSEKVDIWSAGVILHALLIDVLPFKGDSLDTMFEAIKNDKLEFTGGHWESVSHFARDLLSKMLTRNISTRFTANDVLRHPWISFYTEHTMKALTLKPKKYPIRFSSSRLPCNCGLESERFITQSCLGHDSSPTSNFSHSIGSADGEDSGFDGAPKPKRRSTCRPLADGEDSGLIGAPKPKRSRICSSSDDREDSVLIGAPKPKRSRICRSLADGEDSVFIGATKPKRNRICRQSAGGEGSGLIGAPESKRSKICRPLADGEGSGLIDALAVAILRLRISEPERSRIYSPLADGEDTGVIDALVMAISCLRITELKRSRVCSTLKPLNRLNVLSNLNTSNLCTVF